MSHTIRIAVIGDCCADIYVDRVVLGGTAYNVALAAAKAGANASIISAIGTDTIGKRFLRNFKKNKIDTSNLSIVSGKSDTIQIRLDKQGKPSYSNWQTAAIETVCLTDPTFLRKHDVVRAVLFTSTERLFREFCALKLSSTIKVGDFAGTSPDSFDISAIEPYAKNLDVIIKSVEDRKSLSALQSIAHKYDCLVLALLGSKGSTVFTKNKAYHEPAKTVRTKNTTGAGDVYQANFLVTYLRTKNIPLAMHQATMAAANAIS